MTWLALLLALGATFTPQQPLLQFGGLYPGVPWKGITSYIAQRAPRRAVCLPTTENAPAALVRSHACAVRRLLLTNDIRANVTFTVDDSSGEVASIVVAYRPRRPSERAALIDTLTRIFGPADAADNGRGAANWRHGPRELHVTAQTMAGTVIDGVQEPIVVMLIDTPLNAILSDRVTKAAAPAR